MVTLIYFVLILGVIVLVHEAGHFFFAKLFGIYVHEFSIGMGPKIFGRRRKNKNDETEYCIRAIPIGGFVSLAGEEVDDNDGVPREKKLYAKKPWQRFLVMFFGAGNNFIFAALLLFLIAIIWGAPDQTARLVDVSLNLPAYEAGLRQGDIITSINGKKVKTLDDLTIYMQLADKTEKLEIGVLRDGKETVYEVMPELQEIEGNEAYVVGITMGTTEVERGLFASVRYMWIKMGSLFRQMFVTIQGLFTGGIGVNQLSGPVGIYNIVGEQRTAGVENVLYLIALLSVNVGVINLIPLPAVDGGRILFLLIEKIKGSPVSSKVENMIHSIGFILLMLLMVYITFNDIFRLF